MIEFTEIRTSEDVLAYDFIELKNKTIETVTLDNEIITKDQFTLSGTTFTMTDSDRKISNNQLLKIGYRWVKKV